MKRTTGRTTGISAWLRRNGFAVVGGAVGLGGIVWFQARGAGWHWYATLAVGILTFKLVASASYRQPRHVGYDPGTVAVIVPVLNEDPATWRSCLRSLVEQSRVPDEIWVIDDGSDTDESYRIAEAELHDQPGARVHRLVRNRGKRFAQAWALERSAAQVFVTVDSDTVVEHDAIAAGISSFANRRVRGVTGNVRVLNHSKNLLTRLIDLRYANAFLFDRAAYSAFGSVLCACGSLSFWRRDVLIDNLDDYTSQQFLGVTVPYGDDRRLTNYALTRGRVLFQEDAVAHTLVPERFGHFLRQQMRWNKSFFRETLWTLRNLGPRTWAWWFALTELVMWTGVPVVVLGITLVRMTTSGGLPAYLFLAYLALMAYIRSLRYVGSPGRALYYEVGVFLLAPLYGILQLGLLVPLRVASLLTLRGASWGTRSAVEVRLSAAEGMSHTTSASPPLAGPCAVRGDYVTPRVRTLQPTR